MAKIFAILHDGTMNGDCAGDPLEMYEVTNTPDITFKGVLDLCRAQLEKETFDEDDIEEFVKDLKGAWIIDDNTAHLMKEVAKVASASDDGSTYTLQRALKAIARRQAVRSIGKKA